MHKATLVKSADADTIDVIRAEMKAPTCRLTLMKIMSLMMFYDDG